VTRVADALPRTPVAPRTKEDGGEDGGNDGDGATNGVVVRRGGRRQTPDEGAAAGRRALTGCVRVYSTL